MILYITRIGKKQLKLATDFPRHEKVYNTTAVKKAVKLFREEFNLKKKKIILYEVKDENKKTQCPPPIDNPIKTWIISRALLYATEQMIIYRNALEGSNTQPTEDQVIREAREYVQLSLQAEKKEY